MNIDELLLQKFGYSTWKEGQREIITDILDGKNVVAMLATGGGKSLCYQLSAYFLEGSVLIISPLLSLMEDQVEQLRAVGEKRVIAFNSFRSSGEKRLAMENLAQYKFIFVSPEMLQYDLFFQQLRNMKISLFVVDEAHCISQWGYEFRPDYLRLKDYLQGLGSPTCLGLTGTATKEVVQDIVHHLQMEQVSYHLHSINRKNIAIVVEELATVEEKIDRLIDYVKQLQGAGIIYCSSRNVTEKIAERLKDLGNVEAYHGGMTSEQRMLIQQQFMNNQLSIIVSTSAFGMGVNKSNVRYVIHFHYPANMEAYLQEIGRCGRDGLDSIAILLTTPYDYELPLQLVNDELPTMGQVRTALQFLTTGVGVIDESKWRFMQYHLQKLKVLEQNKVNQEKINGELYRYFQEMIEERKQHKQKSLWKMKNWVESRTCRRVGYLEIFGEELTEKPTNCCDICGVDMEHYHKRGPEQQFSKLTWERELQIIFGMGEFDEKIEKICEKS